MLNKLILAATLIIIPGSALAVNYEIDSAHTNVQFAVRHLMISNVKGVISKVSGKVIWDQKNPENSSVEATLDPNSIDTRESKRDEHLRSPEFLDTAKFPIISFKSKKISAPAPGKLLVTGDLSIHGVSREVTLDVDGPVAEIMDPWGNIKTGASATAKINRKDFGLTWNKILETGGVAVGEEVLITLEVELVRKSG